MKYWRQKRQDRLYKQWTEHAELPSEAVPLPEVPAETVGRAAGESRFYRFRVGVRNGVEKLLGLK